METQEIPDHDMLGHPPERQTGLRGPVVRGRIQGDPRFDRRRLAAAAGLLVLVLLGIVFLVARPKGSTQAPPGWRGLSPGGTWQATSLKLQTNALLTDPRYPHPVLAATNGGLWVSKDGSSWRRAGLPEKALVSLSSTPSGRIAVGDLDGGVYLGTPFGEETWNWHPIKRSLGSDHPAISISISPDGRRILLGTLNAVYRGSQVKGRWRWSSVTRVTEAPVTSVTWAPWNRQRAFAAVGGASPSVLTSTDGGATWRPDTRGLPNILPAWALLPIPGDRLVLTTMGRGVWERQSDGRWRNITVGLPAHHAMPVTADQTSGTLVLYAGTMGNGVYAKQDKTPWLRLGNDMTGNNRTALGITVATRPRRVLLVGTLGVFKYVP